MKTDYRLLDTGNGRRLEQFGGIRLVRAAKQAVWRPAMPESEWAKADAVFDEKWDRGLPDFQVSFGDIIFQLSTAENGQVGVFPEQLPNWQWLADINAGQSYKVLNGFAYTGGSTLFTCKGAEETVHLDASAKSVNTARKNLELSGLTDRNVRFITDDLISFMQKEVRRGTRYDGFIFDPPAFGRGGRNKTWKLEKDLPVLINLMAELSGGAPAFVLLSAHEPTMDSETLARMITPLCRNKSAVEKGRLVMKTESGQNMHNGYFARFTI